MNVARLVDREVGDGRPPFLVAELSANHDGDLDRALAIVDAAAEAGVDAIKIQTYRADEITIESDSPVFQVDASHGLWGGQHLIDLYRRAETPWDWHGPIFDRARELGLIPFSSPFSPKAIDFLEALGCPIYKVASPELVDLPLIAAMAATGKPLVISTGMATLAEIEQALVIADAEGCNDLVLLVCTSSYPSSPADANLARIPLLKAAFGYPVGLSDHTRGITVSVAAVALGAALIEKHVLLSRSSGGLDAEFSLDPTDLRQLRSAADDAYEAVGAARFGPLESEADVLRLRRSLYVVEDVSAGDIVNDHNVRSIRPSGGLPPHELRELVGRTFRVSVPRGTPMSWSLV